MKKILIDSDALFSLYNPNDAHHARCKKILNILLSEDTALLTLNLVIQETATVLSYKIGQDSAKSFVVDIDALALTHIDLDRELEEKAWEIFLAQTKKGTSFIDCANLATLHYYNLSGILTFDQFYPKNLRVG